jgi:DNA modification methylase
MTEHHIIQGDVLAGLRTLPDCCIQTCITSPPYYGLRNYGCDGQIGLEDTPELFVAKMVEVFREVRRVLRDDGTLWLNLGDCYASSPVGHFTGSSTIFEGRDMSGYVTSAVMDKSKTSGLAAKNMLGMPWRVAFALQADGWYLRSDIIWAKPNPMPESVTDRPTKAHEYIFLLTKNAHYYYDADAIREEATTIENRPMGCERARSYEGKLNIDENAPEQFKKKANKQDQTGNPTYTGFNERYNAKMARNGTNIPGHSGNFKADGTPICDGITRNARTVWTITTQARPEAHFATFPDEIPRRCIKAGTSEYGCCPKCGKPWERVVEYDEPSKPSLSGIEQTNQNLKNGRFLSQRSTLPIGAAGNARANHTSGWQPGCSCDNGAPVPCVVLDPFMGSGTVAVVARELNRSSIGCELNPAYIKIIKARLQSNSCLDTGVVSYKFEVANG